MINGFVGMLLASHRNHPNQRSNPRPDSTNCCASCMFACTRAVCRRNKFDVNSNVTVLMDSFDTQQKTFNRIGNIGVGHGYSERTNIYHTVKKHPARVIGEVSRRGILSNEIEDIILAHLGRHCSIPLDIWRAKAQDKS
eukprot:1348181-Amphidinium_carterae.1